MEQNQSGGRLLRDGARHRVLRALLACLTGAVLGLPAPARAQDTAPAPLRESPLEWLLSVRSELGLTEDQAERLQTVRHRLHARNEPLISRLMVLRAEWQRERSMLRRSGAERESPRLQQIRRRSDVLYLQIRRHNRAAMGEVNRVLTPAQRQRVRELLEERRSRGGPGSPLDVPGEAAEWGG